MAAIVIIPFFRAHGAGNDFLFSWRHELPEGLDLRALARAICHRHFGVGGDGWYVMSHSSGADAEIHLYNSDGSEAELSGNGTRCAAAVLMQIGESGQEWVRVQTGAGLRELRLLDRHANRYQFEMGMGRPVVEHVHFDLPLRRGSTDVVIAHTGNPQCAVDLATLGQTSFDFDWQSLGAEIEAHPHFPHRSNVSFFNKISENLISARFFERGAGATLSSGTGATGVAVAARARNLVEGPVTIRTEAGDLKVRWQGADVYLTGPAEVIARGEYYG